MKILFLFASLISFAAWADTPSCVPNDSVVCTISAFCDQNTMYYSLKTTFQDIDTTYVDAGSGTTCQVDAKLGSAAHTKLKAQAQQLISAGACKLVIDNL
jgi:hypothetical protein